MTLQRYVLRSCHVAALTAAAALGGCTTEAPEAPAAPEPEAKVNVAERVATTARPAIVRIMSGCFGNLIVAGRSIEIGNGGHGSGFFIHSDGYVMTNAHVVEATHAGDRACTNKMVENLAVQFHGVEGRTAQEWYEFFAANGEVRDFQRVALVQLQTGKTLPFEVKEYGAPIGEGQDMRIGKDVAVIKVEMKNAPTLELGDSSKMKVGDRVWVLGYPGKAEIRGLFDEKSALQPNTTQGAITSTRMTTDGAPVLGTDAAFGPGNSGGAALDENGRVIGLPTFTKADADVSNFGYLVASNTGKEFVPHAASDTDGNQVDELWKDGLESYWKGDYAEAKRKFKRVVELQPEHVEAPRLIAELNEAHGDEIDAPAPKPKAPKKSSPDLRVIGAIAGGAVLLGVVALMLLLAARAQRRRTAARKLAAQPAQTPGYPPAPYAAGYPPVAAGYPPVAAGYPPVAAPPVAAGYPMVPQSATMPQSPTMLQSPALALAPTQAVRAVAARTVAFTGPLARLTCTAGPLKGREFPIGLGVVIGRDATRANIVVDDAGVSGAHLWVGPKDGRIVAMDCGSTNGSFLNERYQERVREAPLGNGDVVTIGQSLVKFALVA